ncbi:MAG: hypothetical protein CBD87_006580 [Rhizobiales bacterium TMED227]|nr:MAG: hypothetical protein CBD87_006580 [Rhizobiales bacterium TMED227]|tara:strand:+ start:50 stop:646 length:597 start_codon:yes stop_codon:yes gene_type:complete
MNSKYPTLDDYLKDMNLILSENKDVIVCSGYNCNFKKQIKFEAEDVEYIRSIFVKRDSRSPYEERQMIASAIATMETITGEIVGTKNDKGGVLENEYIGDKTKQDCVDESATTTSYLNFLIEHELIFLHEIVVPQSRGALIDGRWPHFSAVIRDKTTKKQYVVDSWFRDNGKPPVIMELQDWVFDWRKSNQVVKDQLN